MKEGGRGAATAASNYEAGEVRVTEVCLQKRGVRRSRQRVGETELACTTHSSRLKDPGAEGAATGYVHVREAAACSAGSGSAREVTNIGLGSSSVFETTGPKAGRAHKQRQGCTPLRLTGLLALGCLSHQLRERMWRLIHIKYV